MIGFDASFGQRYSTMETAALAFRDANPRRLTITAPGPEGTPWPVPNLPGARHLADALRDFDAIMPLERDPDRGVWERMELTVSSDGSHV